MRNLETMQPLAIDKFDFLILKQLFPNFKLSIEEIMNKIEKLLIKELENLSKYDIKRYFGLEKIQDITEDHILECASTILFDFDYDELFYEIDTRLNEKLSKLQIEDEEHYQLTKYGLEIYNRIGLQTKGRIRDKTIEIKEIVDLSTLKIRTLIAHEFETDNQLIVTLTQQNIKQAKFNYWEITKRPIYIQGIENELGIFKTVFYFQFHPPQASPSMTFTILAFERRTPILGDYILRNNTNSTILKVKSSMLEPFIPLTPENWNYLDGLYESVRGGLELRMIKPVLGTGIVLGFDDCIVIGEEEDYLEEVEANLVDMALNTKEKDFFQVPIAGYRYLIINWTDLENQLEMERKDILKKKNSFKRRGDEPMLIRIEGDIRKKEIRVEENHQKIFFYLDEPEITRENF